jgi:hypothetical protein
MNRKEQERNYHTPILLLLLFFLTDPPKTTFLFPRASAAAPSVRQLSVLPQDFFAKAPEPPEDRAIRGAVQLLQQIGALDEGEDITLLGKYLGSLSIEPLLGKVRLCVRVC